MDITHLHILRPSEEEGPEGSEGKTIDSVARETWSPIPELLFPSRVSVQR